MKTVPLCPDGSKVPKSRSLSLVRVSGVLTFTVPLALRAGRVGAPTAGAATAIAATINAVFLSSWEGARTMAPS